MATQNAQTQEFVSVRDIKENVVIQKNGQLTMILLASSINFALKSLDEQQAILHQFQNFLNTIDFSLQIYMQSRRLNIEPYLEILAGLENGQDNDLMRIQLREYMAFIRSFTVDVDVMSKNFFVAVSYTPGVADMKKRGLFSSKKSGSTPNDTAFEEQRTQLEQRISLVVDGLSRIGVRTIALGNDELVELFYHIYNPSDPTGAAPLSQN